MFAKQLVAALAALLISTVSAGTAGEFFIQRTAPQSRAGLGGIICAGCTVITGMVDQLAQVHNENYGKALLRLCDSLPTPYSTTCRTFRLLFGSRISSLLTKGETPDTACIAMKICAKPADGQKMCHLFPSKLAKSDAQEVRSHINQLLREIPALNNGRNMDPRLNLCGIPLLGTAICNYLNTQAFSLSFPVDDNDKDGFSDQKTLRGSNWRGKDCFDGNSNSYPGRKPTYQDSIVDTNCNGISGIDRTISKPHEDVLCAKSNAKGIVVLGDSVAANFHVPGQWFNATVLSADMYKNLTYMMENSLNWPHTSVYTGHENVTWSIIDGTTDSLYLRMRERNLCNHRDFQNLGVNGATITEANIYAQNLKRDPQNDKPAIVLFSYIGNDVCKYGNPAALTTPAEAVQGLLDTMATLDRKLPAGSHVIVIGVADARPFFSGIHDQIHPFGSVRNDVKYSDFYDWLTCLGINPCRGWLTTDESIHTSTAQLVLNINVALERTVAESQGRFKNFEMVYLPNPILDVISQQEALGGKGWQLVEAFDGFHPNQKGHKLMAEVSWRAIERKFPHIIGPVNPNNDRIRQLFGDQGGH